MRALFRELEAAVGRGSIAGALYLCPSISELIRFPICVPFVSILIAPTSAALSLVEPQLLGLWSSPLIGPRLAADRRAAAATGDGSGGSETEVQSSEESRHKRLCVI